MNKVQRRENGVYYWTGIVDVGYENKTFRIVLGVCGGMCLMFIVMGLFMGGDMMKPILLSCLAVMAIAGGVCWLFSRNAGNRGQRYEMTEDCILFLGGKRSTNPFPFKSIRKAVVFNSRNMIELYQLVGSGPVFVPHEDFGFVRDYILRRIPDSAEVIYEWNSEYTESRG